MAVAESMRVLSHDSIIWSDFAILVFLDALDMS